jgi:F0F1-type ATP synthase alpha subunit
MPMELQVVDLYAVVNKLFLEVPVKSVKAAENAWLEFVNASRSEVIADIRKTGALSDDSKLELNKAMEEFRIAHKEFFA